MAPLGKSGLRTETIIGDNTFQNEEVTKEYYSKNLQDSKQRAWGTNTHDCLPFGQQQAEIKSTDAVAPTDEKLEQAMADDLAKRGVSKAEPKKPRKAPAKAKTKTTTDSNK